MLLLILQAVSRLHGWLGCGYDPQVFEREYGSANHKACDRHTLHKTHIAP